ncbi:ABC transporter substrate-binding protein [Catellatospora sp. TT07R-123]|uniref:ABC transporter substrate-binding protein n=1 Tax=Catellatospora sp. TT07R-123 TaxID=2733863 RepID=UPI001B15A369|nr:ABC transporter substrate-binding protein [Catellatospora sp. TT07R-123]GHJ47823.1 ABC transporter substrate-binding protein [Catellatospora sp. TT07R-123]
MLARPTNLTRRGFLGAAGLAGLGTVLAACGGTDTPVGAAASSGPWAFTDDRGVKVGKDKAPTRIVAFTGTAAALYDFGVKVTGVFGPTTLKDGSADPQAGNLPVTDVTVLGNTWGEFNVEKYAGLSPELLVTNTYVKDALWYVPDEAKDKIAQLAPSVAFNMIGTDLQKIIERYAAFAASLGADLAAPPVADAKKRFETAAEAIRTAARANGGLKVMACSGSADLFYVSTPSSAADLTFFESLGVTFVQPDNVEGGFFESLSWEKAGKYAADVLLLDSRSGTLQPTDLAAKPTWAGLPAVKAGQITPWLSEPRFSYAGAAPLLETLATALQNAKKVA